MLRRALVALLLLVSAPARAQAPEVAGAWNAFQQGRTDEAAQQARRQLPVLTSDAARRDAHLLLAACAFVREDLAAARAAVITALSFDPGYQPDPLLLAPDLQALVRRVAQEEREAIREQAAARQRAAASQPARPATQPAPPASRPVLPPAKPVEPTPEQVTPLYLAVLPFGVGQLANGQHIKGWLLLGGESTLGATSIGCLAAALALRDESGRYRPGDIDRARALNVVYLATAYAALGLMIYGAIDGVYHRRRAGRAADAGALVPLVLPGGGGLALGQRF
jgi:hypothetical protein